MTDALTEAARARARRAREEAKPKPIGFGTIEILLFKNRHGTLHVRLTASDRRAWRSGTPMFPPQTSYTFGFSWDAFQRNVYEFARMIGVEL